MASKSWDEWFKSATVPAVGPRPRKKKKPFIGPTKASVRSGRGLASAAEGRPNTVVAPIEEMPGADLPPGPKIPGTDKPLIPQTLLELATMPVGAVLAQGVMATTPGSAPGPSETVLEQQIRAINRAYFQHTGVLPSPSMVTALLSTPATARLTTEQYVSLLRGVERIPQRGDTSHVEVGFFQPEKVQQVSQLGGYRGPPMPDEIKAQMPFVYPLTNVDQDKVRSQLEMLVAAHGKQNRSAADFALLSDKNQQIVAFSRMIADRLRNRGAPVEWDEDQPWQDSDFLRYAGVYAMGQQFAYSTWGNPQEQAKANQTIEYLRSLPFSSDSWSEIGQKLGVPMADWQNQQTVGAVIDALRNTDNDMAHKVIYDAWMFGRPSGESPSQTRYRYAEKFGAERLPAKDRQEFEQSTQTINGLLTKVMSTPGREWAKLNDVPWVGRLTAPIGWAAGQGMKWGFSYPAEEIMRSFAAVVDLSVQADPSVFERGYTQQEYMQAMSRHETAKSAEWWKLWKFHWGVFIDGSRLNAAWEDNAGRNPFTDIAEQVSVEQYGYIKPWIKDVGDIANFSAQFYLGAKMDPIVRGGVGLAGKGAFRAGRAAEASFYDIVRTGQYGARWRAAEGRWTISNPHVDNNGVHVVDLIDPKNPEKVITTDETIAPLVKRLNEEGFTTHQSHGLPEDHPAGYPAKGLPQYIEFRKDQLSGLKREDVETAAKDAGLTIESRKADIGGGEMVDTILVKGDGLKKFVDYLAPPRRDFIEADMSHLLPEDQTAVRMLREEWSKLDDELARDAEVSTRHAVKRGVTAETKTAIDQPGGSDAELLAHIKALAKENGGLKERAEFWDSALSDAENRKNFLGLTRANPGAKMGRAFNGITLEEIADRLSSGDKLTGRIEVSADDLWEVLQREKQRRATGRAPAAKRITPAQMKAKMARMAELEQQIEDVIAVGEERVYSSAMFDTTDYLAEGAQGSLVDAHGAPADLGYGEKTAPVAELRPKAPEQMPGQTAIGDVPAASFESRVAALDVFVQNGEFYDRFIADAVNDARWMVSKQRFDEAERLIALAESRAETLKGTKLAPPEAVATAAKLEPYQDLPAEEKAPVSADAMRQRAAAAKAASDAEMDAELAGKTSPYPEGYEPQKGNIPAARGKEEFGWDYPEELDVAVFGQADDGAYSVRVTGPGVDNPASFTVRRGENFMEKFREAQRTQSEHLRRSAESAKQSNQPAYEPPPAGPAAAAAPGKPPVGPPVRTPVEVDAALEGRPSEAEIRADEARAAAEMEREPTTAELDRMDAELAALNAEKARMDAAMRSAEKELGYENSDDLSAGDRVRLHRLATEYLRGKKPTPAVAAPTVGDSIVYTRSTPRGEVKQVAQVTGEDITGDLRVRHPDGSMDTVDPSIVRPLIGQEVKFGRTIAPQEPAFGEQAKAFSGVYPEGTPSRSFGVREIESAGFPVHIVDKIGGAIEFVVIDMRKGYTKGDNASAAVRARLAKIRDAAVKSGGRVVKVKRKRGDYERSVVRVEGADPVRFTAEMRRFTMPENIPPETRGAAYAGPGTLGPGGTPPGTPSVPGGPGVVPPEGGPINPLSGDPTAPLRNAIFRINAEVLAKVDSASYIRWLYQIPEDNPALIGLTKKLAEAKTVEEVRPLLDRLREHGVEIDGGASAFYKNMRQSAYIKGFGRTNFLRFFITPTTYGKTHGIEGSTDMMFNVMVATKLGLRKMTPESWQRIRELRDKLGEETSALGKRTIVTDIWKEIEGNIIKERGSLDGLNRYENAYHKAQGRAIRSGNRRAYFGQYKDGVAVEGSRVVTTGKTKSHVDAALIDAEAQLADITSGISPKLKKKLESAVEYAKKQVKEVDDAIETIDKLAEKPLAELSVKEQSRLFKAKNVLDDYGTVVPMKMGQRASHIVHTRNPRIVAQYMAGKPSIVMGLVDQALLQPIMTVFKETVMSVLGFPIRVNIGDEYVRLIPEGTLRRMREAGKAKSQAKSEGLWGDELDAEIHDKLAYDWVASDSGDWILVTKQTHPRYYQYLAQDLRSWAAEPIVKRLLAMHKGEFPDELPDIHWFISQLSKENSKLGIEMRSFLDDTYRSVDGVIDQEAFTDWTSLWEDRLTAISKNATLRKSMIQTVDAAELQANVPDELLWPVNAPEQIHAGGSSNPLNLLVRANPFHYIYNGIPVGGGRRAGSLQLLGAMSNWLRETMFADRYYLERKAMLEQRPGLGATAAGRLELHQNAAERALRYTNRTTYSRSTTMFEDMTRNLIPFGNAYRQFWQYWLSAFAKHPVSMSVFLKNYAQAQQSIGNLVGQASAAVGGPEITLDGQFLGIGDYQVYLPAVPFLAVQDESASGGPLGIATSNIPQAGLFITTGARTLMGALNMDPANYQNLPGMAGLGSMAPFSRQARLLYGVTGWTMSGNSVVEGLFGNPRALEKAHTNAVLAQLAYDENGTGPEVSRNKPWWWRAAEDLFGAFGIHDVKPEALFSEAWKTFVPSPAGASYSPKVTRDKGNWSYEYYKAIREGKTQAAAKLRAEHPWLDRYLSYYDATPTEQVAMKRDPANAEMLKWWVSPYNYAKDGGPLDGRDWQTQFTSGRVSYKTEQQYITSIHNLYTDIHGGTYLQSDTRTGGTQYAGDNPRETAEKRTKAKIEQALVWATKMARYAAKERGWDQAVLMEQFKSPSKNWGLWPEILRLNGKDPAQYNIETIAAVFADKYGADYKINPQYLSGSDALRALDMAKWLPNPKLEKEMLTQTPFAGDVRKARKSQKTAITKAIVESAGLDQWYWLGSQQLKSIGIKASPKIDLIQIELNKDYRALRAMKVGSSEYKAARTAYYSKRDKLLGAVAGGDLISGGVAERLAALPFVLTPQVTLMGTGRGAVAKQTGYDHFEKVMHSELVKSDPNPEHLNVAWDKLVSFRQYAPAQQAELLRVAAWGYLLATAKHLRHEMRTHYSEYYKAPGESSASKYGKAKVDELNKVAAALRTFSPKFSEEMDAWFGKDAEPGTRFLNWYIY